MSWATILSIAYEFSIENCFHRNIRCVHCRCHSASFEHVYIDEKLLSSAFFSQYYHYFDWVHPPTKSLWFLHNQSDPFQALDTNEFSIKPMLEHLIHWIFMSRSVRSHTLSQTIWHNWANGTWRGYGKKESAFSAAKYFRAATKMLWFVVEFCYFSHDCQFRRQSNQAHDKYRSTSTMMCEFVFCKPPNAIWWNRFVNNCECAWRRSLFRFASLVGPTAYTIIPAQIRWRKSGFIGCKTICIRCWHTIKTNLCEIESNVCLECFWWYCIFYCSVLNWIRSSWLNPTCFAYNLNVVGSQYSIFIWYCFSIEFQSIKSCSCLIECVSIYNTHACCQNKIRWCSFCAKKGNGTEICIQYDWFDLWSAAIVQKYVVNYKWLAICAHCVTVTSTICYNAEIWRIDSRFIYIFIHELKLESRPIPNDTSYTGKLQLHTHTQLWEILIDFIRKFQHNAHLFMQIYFERMFLVLFHCSVNLLQEEKKIRFFSE